MIVEAMRGCSIAKWTEVGIRPMLSFDDFPTCLVKPKHQIASCFFQSFPALKGALHKLRGTNRIGRLVIDLREVATFPNARPQPLASWSTFRTLDRLNACVDVDVGELPPLADGSKGSDLDQGRMAL